MSFFKSIKNSVSDSFNWVSGDIAIDLGTANTLIWLSGKGIIINEPSIIARSTKTGAVLAVGDDAKEMLGKTHEGIETIRPLRDGVIADFTAVDEMLQGFIRKVNLNRLTRPRMVICVPSGVTEVERRAVRDSGEKQAAREVFLVDEPVAAAIGIGLDISKPVGNIIVDIGGGTTEVAVISLNGVVTKKAIRVADIHELFEETHAKFVALNADPCSGISPARTLADCERTGVTPNLYGSIEAPASSIATTTGGNSNLSPEKAITSSLGFIFDNQRDYLEVDFYHIDLDDQIGTSDADTILSKCLDTGADKWCSLINRNPTTGTFHEGSGKINTPLLNFVSNVTTGLDVFYKRTYESKLGLINLSNFSNFLIKRDIQQASNNIALNCRGKYENTCGLPSPKIQNVLTLDLLTSFNRIPTNISLRLRYIGSVDDTNVDNPRTSYSDIVPFKSFTYVDPSIKFSFNNLNLRFGINNLFDQDPPVNGQIGYVPGNGNFYSSFYDSLGRFIYLRLSTQL